MAPSEELTLAVADGPNGTGCLEFEKPLAELESQISELRSLQASKGIDYAPEIRQLRDNLVALTGKVYANLSPWETVQVSRHPRRPLFNDYLNLMVKDFCELHGDRTFGDDQAIVTGFGRIGREKVMIVGQHKGRGTQEKIACNFGMPHPEGYRKALLKMKIAEKYNLPIVTFIDTPGAYPGIEAEERGQAQAIAVNLMEMTRLRVPIICIVIGEGGSGGALGIGVGDRVVVLQYAYYSVISPEGCAAILWKDGAQAPAAAEALKLTSGELAQLGVIDSVIHEPLGGAHRNPHETAHNIEAYVVKALRDLKRTKTENLLENRYRKIRSIGEFSSKQTRAAKIFKAEDIIKTARTPDKKTKAPKKPKPAKV